MNKAYILIFLLTSQVILAQQKDTTNDFKNSGWFSLGARSTASTFGDEGNGIGSGGQFRIQMNNAINTDWFFDYISINVDDKVRSEYYHIGWSVIYYPFSQLQYPKLLQPYILAGHCFDYTKIDLIQPSQNKYTELSKERWSSATQVGIGTHINLSEAFNLSLSGQYMIHLGNDIHTHSHQENGKDIIHFDDNHEDISLEGHLLFTISLNYKIAQLW